MASNKSIRDFFKPAQSTHLAMKTATVSRPASEASTFIVPKLAARSSNSPKPPASVLQTRQTSSSASKSSDQQEYTSSLSPPPSSESDRTSPAVNENIAFPTPGNPLQAARPNTAGDANITGKPEPPSAVNRSSEKEIQDSDEDDGSDDSLEDLDKLLAARSAQHRERQAANKATPSTPNAKRFQSSTYQFQPSPVARKPKFDMKSLISDAAKEAATEESSKRVKEMLAAKFEDEIMVNGESSIDHERLLDSVVGDREDGTSHKIKRALRRTEATITEKRYYFFDTSQKLSKTDRKPFPAKSISSEWKADLWNKEIRYQTFVSGFAEDMIVFGQRQLPDELFLWMLDEICYEPSEPLRSSYLNILGACPDTPPKAISGQLNRLLVPETIRRLFQLVGGTPSATSVDDNIRPVQKLSEPYSSRDWSRLLSLVKLLGQSAASLQLQSKNYITSMLLRMSMDRVIFKNVDIFDCVQATIARLCRSIKEEEEWQSSCSSICKTLFATTEEPSLRLQMLESISSTHPRPHDLRRRLAMCFFFKDISYSLAHSHTLMDLNKVIDRLYSKDFNTNSKTDFRELAALILILDIAVDDGRPLDLDLADKAIEDQFNADVETLCLTIKEIMQNIGNPGAAFISKIIAKENLEIVSQRIADTVRTKARPKKSVFNTGVKEEDLEREKRGMMSFLGKANVRVKEDEKER